MYNEKVNNKYECRRSSSRGLNLLRAVGTLYGIVAIKGGGLILEILHFLKIYNRLWCWKQCLKISNLYDENEPVGLI